LITIQLLSRTINTRHPLCNADERSAEIASTLPTSTAAAVNLAFKLQSAVTPYFKTDYYHQTIIARDIYCGHRMPIIDTPVLGHRANIIMHIS
jgi:hypothetical protein